MAATKLDLKMVMTNMMMGFYRSPYQMAATKLDLKMVMTNMMMGFYRSPYQTILFYVIFPFITDKRKGLYSCCVIA